MMNFKHLSTSITITETASITRHTFYFQLSLLPCQIFILVYFTMIRGEIARIRVIMTEHN